MIATDLAHLSEQVISTPAMDKAIAFLRSDAWRALPAGRIEIDGDTVYALVQSYQTRPPEQGRFEAHRKYIDVQFVASGSELVRWANLETLTETDPYDETRDVLFGATPESAVTELILGPGELAVFYPCDAHAPTLAVYQPAPVKKIVVKVAVEA